LRGKKVGLLGDALRGKESYDGHLATLFDERPLRPIGVINAQLRRPAEKGANSKFDHRTKTVVGRLFAEMMRAVFVSAIHDGRIFVECRTDKKIRSSL